MSALYEKLLSEAAQQPVTVRGQRVKPEPAVVRHPQMDVDALRELLLFAIAALITADPAYAPAKWCDEPHRAALATMEAIEDSYGADDGRGIVAYLVSNLAQWRGPRARAVKAELSRRLAA